jgi:hypothetical protein
MSSTEYGENLDGNMAAAIQQVIGGIETGIVTKFVVIAEAMNEEGQRSFWTFCTPGAMSWDTKGLLLEALDAETARSIRDRTE